MNPCPVMMAQGLLRLLVVSLKKGYRPMPFACMLPGNRNNLRSGYNQWHVLYY